MVSLVKQIKLIELCTRLVKLPHAGASELVESNSVAQLSCLVYGRLKWYNYFALFASYRLNPMLSLPFECCVIAL